MLSCYRVVSLSFPDRPDWQVLDDHVPIGQVYTVDQIKTAFMTNSRGETRQVVVGRDVTCGQWIPLDTMRLVES